MNMDFKVEVMLSNRHVHLCEEDMKTLFGDGGLTIKNYLGDSGQFASVETVTLKGPKGSIANVRVLGPLRPRTQAEVLQGDCYKLGMDVPCRISYDLDDAAEITIIGSKGSVTKKCAIVAQRHIHLPVEKGEELKLENGANVRVATEGPRAMIMENVSLRIKGHSGAVMHVDTEEGNAAGLKNHDVVTVIV